MPIIATKVIAGTIAAATALGSVGFAAKEDITQTAQLAANYVEVKIDRHAQEMGREALHDALGSRFSDMGGNPH